MRDWESYWNSVDTKNGALNDWRSMMGQVGKTLQQQPISDDQFRKTYQKIIQALSLEGGDEVLDLCCGNGVITMQIAPFVQHIFGVDFSRPLIDVAVSMQTPNASYYCGSALDAKLPDLLGRKQFRKIYMNTALQHFAEQDFGLLLDNIITLSADSALFYITDIPEKKNLFNFYNTEDLRKDYHERVKNGTEAIGTWWDREFLETVARTKGLSIKTMDQAPDLYTCHYRFDALIGINTPAP